MAADDITKVRGASKREAIRRLLPAGTRDDVDRVYEEFRQNLARTYASRGVAAIAGAAEVFTELRRRKVKVALSTGFDRQRVIDVVWGGIADPKNYTLSPQSWHYVGDKGQEVYKSMAENAIAFDAAAANALLDGLGMNKDAEGFRTLPSGEPFELTVDISDWGGSLKVQEDSAAAYARIGHISRRGRLITEVAVAVPICTPQAGGPGQQEKQSRRQPCNNPHGGRRLPLPSLCFAAPD